MKKNICFLILLVFACSNAFTRQEPSTVFISKDSLYKTLNKGWVFKSGDDTAWKQPDLNDSTWNRAHPSMEWVVYSSNTKTPKDTIYSFDGFKGMAWYRLHFIADSSITGRPLALRITHLGASEIYLDGEKIGEFGIINGKDSTKNYDPQKLPFIFEIPEPGLHLLAIRYANYQAEKNYRFFNEDFVGFSISIGEPNPVIAAVYDQAIALTFILIFLFGIFTAISILHLLLYLYYRSTRSNLSFSLFSFSIALGFLILFFIQFSNNPYLQLYSGFAGLFVICIACISLSSFLNQLFNKKKISFYVITAMGLLSLIMRLIDIDFAFYAAFVLIFSVSLEAVIIILIAIFRKVKGARIIGAGLLLFTILILVLFILAITVGNFDINDSTTEGQIVELIIAFAILSIPVSMSAYLAWNFSTVNKDLKAQLTQVQILSEKTLKQELEKQHMLKNRQEELEQEVAQRTLQVRSQKEEIEKQHEQLKAEKKKSDDLLLNILPEEVAEELKQNGLSEAKLYDNVSVLFTDFVNFTEAGERLSPQQLVDELHTCFKTFDDIIGKYNIEKIKTIGDAYLAVGGLPIRHADHAENILRAAMEIRLFMEERKKQLGNNSFEIRIGIHSGPVVAGIVGVKKFAYDIWGDTVNTAARMEQNSEAGKINISQTTYELVKDKFTCTYRGEIEAKNKGAMKMYFVEPTVAFSTTEALA